MSEHIIARQSTGTHYPEPRLYLNQHGDLYQTPETRAELIRHLHLQRRIVRHLADVIIAIGRGREVQL
jgi:hypothetical protein